MSHAVETRASSLADATDRAAGVGRTALGTISIGDRVVSKIAARAAVEVPDAGAAATRVLGRTVPGAGHLGLRGTDLDGLPKTSVDVDGSKAYIDLTIGVRWPAPVAEVSEQVRSSVQERVGELTGLSVDEVRITVADLVTHIVPPPRVR